MGKSASEVKAEIEDTRQDMSETIDAIADRTSPRRIIDRRRRRMANGWRTVRERVMGRAQSAGGTASDHARNLSGSARDTAGSVIDTARGVPSTVSEQTQGNPIAAGLMAFGAGLLIASLVPPSEPEQQLAGTLKDQTQPLQDELTQAGQQVVEDVKSTARYGADQVKQRAADATGTLQDDIRSSTQELQDQARS
jgi:Protein of unknown function (DUF3618)